MFGKLVFKTHLRPNGDRIDIDAGGWKPGIYFVRMLCGERILGVEKVVIQ